MNLWRCKSNFALNDLNPAVCPICRVVKAKIEFCVSFSSSPEPWAVSRPAYHNRNSNVSTSASKHYFLDVVPKMLQCLSKDTFVEHFSRTILICKKTTLALTPKIWSVSHSLTLSDFHSALLWHFTINILTQKNWPTQNVFNPNNVIFLEIMSSIMFIQGLF